MKIAEIFSSLQGEGKTSGYPTLFIRLAGCNLACSYCDTPASHQAGRESGVDQVICEAIAVPIPRICITGGEPLLQAGEVTALARALSQAGRIIGIETNGTLDFRAFQPYASICMDVKCPSSGEKSDLSLLSAIREEDSVKFVIGTEEDLRYAEEVIASNRITGEIFFSPVYGTDYHRIAAYILEKNLPVRLQLQLHKIIGVP